MKKIIIIDSISNYTHIDISNKSVGSSEYQLYNLIKKQYNCNNYSIYWDSEYYSHMSMNSLNYMYRLETGFSLSTLLDNTGLFYIIHPFENSINQSQGINR